MPKSRRNLAGGCARNDFCLRLCSALNHESMRQWRLRKSERNGDQKGFCDIIFGRTFLQELLFRAEALGRWTATCSMSKTQKQTASFESQKQLIKEELIRGVGQPP